MFGDFQYTTMRKEMPLQNALFLLIPVSYVAGWTLQGGLRHQSRQNAEKNRMLQFYLSFRAQDASSAPMFKV
jgi:hypothetical protein